jgi:hypothetical protein
MVCGGRGYRGLRPVEVTKRLASGAVQVQQKARDSGRWGIALRQRLP